MRTFLIALVCSVAAFFGGIATILYIATNDTGTPAFSSPGSAYWHWANAKTWSSNRQQQESGRMNQYVPPLRWASSARRKLSCWFSTN